MPGAGYALIVIAVVAAVTVFIRATPFLFFGGDKPVPRIVIYLGRALPPAVIAMLVVYCFKDVAPASWHHGLPELIAAAIVVGLQAWKKNSVLSIFSGTAVYMLLVQVVFA